MQRPTPAEKNKTELLQQQEFTVDQSVFVGTAIISSNNKGGG